MLQRLIPALAKIGVETRFKENHCDVALGVSKWRTKPNMPRVLRVDGVHLRDGKKERWRNKNIRKSIKQSHAVIFQSKFAQKTVKKRLGVQPLKEYVIFNGANPADYEGAFMNGINVISSAKWCHRNGWRKQKKLKTVIKVAKRMPHVKFFVAGKMYKPQKSADNLTFLGYLEEAELRKYLRSADVMFYPASMDWCANAVIEAICAGCPVVGTSEHGVTELIEACGGKVADTTEGMIDAIDRLLKNPMIVNKNPVHIENVALKYKEVFESVLV